MKSKMDSMYTNQVWTLVDQLEGTKPVGYKWVYKRKINIDGNIQMYKVILVAKGYNQEEDIQIVEAEFQG